MKRTVSICLAAVLAASAFAGCSGNSSPTARDSAKLKILTTIAPQYDWLVNITQGAKDVELTMLLDSGADLHSFQPSADDLYSISNADVFVYTGGESDKWVDKALKNSTDVLAVNLMELLGDKAKQEEAVEGMQTDGHEDSEEAAEYDEHIWLSLKNAEYVCEKICGKLSEKDSANKDVYEKNTKAYTQKLHKLENEYEKAVKDAKFNTLLFADRFPFRYLTDDCNLKYYAAFSGCSAETEASFETVKFLSDKLSELKLPAVMTIDGSDKKIAETVRENSSNKDAEILTLDSMQSMKSADIKNGNDYIKVMTNNLEVLKKALG
ncbi:MAG TPA: zinc ABC transporter substrate-binding protein [Ruminococcaceae bacterium]|nr:zinc ABC transporter substrate-binding protein [Oscillospiraceae bacterium]